MVTFNPMTPEFLENPFALYGAGRAMGPMFIESANLWLVFRYEQALDTLSDMSDFLAFVARDYARVRDHLEPLLSGLGGPWDEIEHGELEPGSVRPSDPQATAQVVMAALIGYHLMETFFDASPGAIDRDRFTAAIAELIHPG